VDATSLEATCLPKEVPRVFVDNGHAIDEAITFSVDCFLMVVGQDPQASLVIIKYSKVPNVVTTCCSLRTDWLIVYLCIYIGKVLIFFSNQSC